MKKIILQTTLMIVVCVITTSQLFAQMDAERLKSEIEAQNSKLIRANLAGDLETLATLYTDDITYMPNYSPMVKGKEALIQREEEGKKAGVKVLSMTLTTQDVNVCDKLAIEIGTYTISMSMPQMEQPISDKGKYMAIWERQKDGSLKMKYDTWNTDVNPMAMSKEKK